MSTFSMFRRPATIALALTSSIAIVACNPSPTPTPSKGVTSVAVTATPTSIAVGANAQATAVVSVTNAAAKTVTWTSSAPTVATVDNMGKITGVAAGTAVIKATSTVDTTKSGSVTITVTGGGTGTTLTTAKINFQTAAAVTLPAGYTTNTGAAYDAATGIGWVTEASVGAAPVALDLTKNARNRGVSNGVTDPRQYTQINMQCNNQLTGNPCSGAELTSGAFQYKVVNGTYDVTVGVGEASNDVNSIMQINLESKTANAVTVLSGFVPAAGDRTLIKTAKVTVADGMLTVDAIGGNNTKINFIEIAPAK